MVDRLEQARKDLKSMLDNNDGSAQWVDIIRDQIMFIDSLEASYKQAEELVPTEAYSIEGLRRLALTLINAMILRGPENEQALHTLLILLDTELHDDLKSAVEDAKNYIDESWEPVEDLLEKLYDELEEED